MTTINQEFINKVAGSTYGQNRHSASEQKAAPAQNKHSSPSEPNSAGIGVPSFGAGNIQPLKYTK